MDGNSTFTLDLDSAIGYGAFGTGTVMDGSDMIVFWGNENELIYSNRIGVGHDIKQQESKWYVITKEKKDNRLILKITRPFELDNRPKIQTTSSFIWCYSMDKINSKDVNAIVPYHDLMGTIRMNLESGSVETLEKMSSPLETSHGVLMCIAWFILIPFSIILTKFFKLKIKNWFKVHKRINLFSFFMICIALLLILIDKNGIVFTGNLDPHPIFGLILFIVLIIQICLGIFIDKTFNPKRSSIPLRDKSHWYLGYFSVFLGLVTLFLGLQSTSSKVYGYLFFSIFVGYLLLWSILSINRGRTHDPFCTPPQSDTLSNSEHHLE